MLKQSFYIQPFDASLHKLAGGIYLDLGNPSEAVREFQVQISLAPPDLAEAHYDLARALEAIGKFTRSPPRGAALARNRARIREGSGTLVDASSCG